MCLSHPQTIPAPVLGIIIFHRTDPWCQRLGTSVLQLSSVFDKHLAFIVIVKDSLETFVWTRKVDGKSSSQVDETGFFSQTTWSLSSQI